MNVPMDAYKMDFVFSDVSGGEGTYDNRGVCRKSVFPVSCVKK